MQAAERSQLRSRLLSADDFNRQQGVAMSITVSITDVQSHTLDVDADEMSNSRRSPSLISISVGADHPCCRKSHGSLRSFSLTGTIFLSIPSHFARIQSSKSQYFTGTNHLPYSFYYNFYWRLASKSLHVPQTSADWFHAVMSHAAVNSDALMHVVFRSLLKIFEYAAKQACKQLQCNKAKLLDPASISGLYNQKGLGYSQHTNYTHQMKI